MKFMTKINVQIVINDMINLTNDNLKAASRHIMYLLFCEGVRQIYLSNWISHLNERGIS